MCSYVQQNLAQFYKYNLIEGKFPMVYKPFILLPKFRLGLFSSQNLSIPIKVYKRNFFFWILLRFTRFGKLSKIVKLMNYPTEHVKMLRLMIASFWISMLDVNF